MSPKYREVVNAENYILSATNFHNEGWHLLSNTHPFKGFEKQLLDECGIISLSTTEPVRASNGSYTFVGNVVTKNGADLIAVIHVADYASFVPETLSILKRAVEIADKSTSVSCSDALETLNKSLPQGMKLVPEYVPTLVTSETKLTTKSISIFSEASDFVPNVVLYDFFEDTVNSLTDSAKIEVGYIEYTMKSEGYAKIDKIPLYLSYSAS